ncbi:hypothetical protein [Coralliovum pocilloporae]|uniref:hypothetical protein n=1 Tax=Coralliovum pocilloporae TaxID=3066369 RepID=UPI0033070C83
MLTRLCLATLPALESAESKITVRSVSNLSAAEVRIDYETYQNGAYDSGVAVCEYGHDAATGNRTALAGIDTHFGRLSETQLWALKRFWLARPGKISEAIDMLAFEDGGEVIAPSPFEQLLALFDGD